MKRNGILVLAMVLVLAITGCSKSNAQSGGGGKASPVSDFSYGLGEFENNKFVYIDGYTGKGGKVVIPSTIEGYPVWVIAGNAFNGTNKSEEFKKSKDFKPTNKDLITSIVIPDSVRWINNIAFAFLEDLTQVTFGNGLEEIGEWAFMYCRKLTSVNIPSSVKLISVRAFEGCKSLKKANLPSSLEELGESAFSGCGELTELIIPDSLTNVKFMYFHEEEPNNYAFEGCGKLPLATRQKLKDLGYEGVFY